MEIYAQIAIKLAIGFLLLFLVTKKIGGREIKNLNAFDFISAIVLSELVGNALYAEELHIGHMLFTIAIWVSLIISIDKITMKSNTIRDLVDGKPNILIKNGSIDKNQLKKNNMDLNELLSLLRQKDIFSVGDIEFAFLEPNGTISFVRWQENEVALKERGNSPGSGISLRSLSSWTASYRSICCRNSAWRKPGSRRRCRNSVIMTKIASFMPSGLIRGGCMSRRFSRCIELFGITLKSFLPLSGMGSVCGGRNAGDPFKLS